MSKLNARLAGFELYFDNLEAAKRFYVDTLGLELDEDDAHHHAKLTAGNALLPWSGREWSIIPPQTRPSFFSKSPAFGPQPTASARRTCCAPIWTLNVPGPRFVIPRDTRSCYSNGPRNKSLPDERSTHDIEAP